jgi:hypothetical protein
MGLSEWPYRETGTRGFGPYPWWAFCLPRDYKSTMINFTSLIVESVRERDIDLLILEEFYSRTGFEQLFLRVIQRPDFSFVGAHRSIVTSSLGETDIQVEFKNQNGSTLHLLIENKIDAEFQNAQYSRYMQRAQLLVGPSVSARVILVAPQAYIDSQNEFEYSVSYESILEFFKAKTSDMFRASYKAEILRLAIEQERRGYQAIKNDLVTSLWRQYFTYIQTYMPELGMEEPKAKPSSSSFLYFRPKWLPEGMKLVHKMEKGYLDLTLEGKASEYETLMQKYAPVLVDGMSLVETNKSVSFRLELPPLSFEETLDDQEETMRQVIQHAKTFKDFLAKGF